MDLYQTLLLILTQLIFICSKSKNRNTREGVKYVQLTIKTPRRCSDVFVVNLEHSTPFSSASFVDFEQMSVSREVNLREDFRRNRS